MKHLHCLTCRQLQFGVKYFVGSGIAIVLVLALQGSLPALRSWRLLFGAPIRIVTGDARKGRPSTTHSML